MDSAFWNGITVLLTLVNFDFCICKTLYSYTFIRKIIR